MPRNRHGMRWAALLCAGACLLANPLAGQDAGVPEAAPDAAAGGKGAFRLTYKDMPIDLVLEEYAQRTGLTLLNAPGANTKATISLRSQGELTLEEWLRAVETVLAMNNIAIVRMDDKFAKVVQTGEAQKEGTPIQGIPVQPRALPEGFDISKLLSQMITVNHIKLEDAKGAIEPLKHAYGQVQLFPHINAMLITDTAEAIGRMLDVITFIDQPVEAREEPHVVQIRYTKASEIQAKLNDIISDALKEQEARRSTIPKSKDTGAPGVVAPPAAQPAVPGVIRARPVAPAAPAAAAPSPEAAIMDDILAQVERGIIQGKVKIVADDRTNILIIITRPENMKFFEKIIKVLDVETAPDVIVRVYRLEFAEAKAVEGMLNNLIGAAGTKEDVKTPTAGTTPAAGEGTSTALREVETQAPERPAEVAGKSKVGELSKDNIKILSDERTNSLIIMARKQDLATLEEIILDMDMMLSQVLIEAVIVEISLTDGLSTGVDWVQRTLVASDRLPNGSRDPISAFAGSAGGGSLTPLDLGKVTPSFTTGGGLTYYLTMFDLSLDTVLRAVATDTRSKVLSSPVILTTDNTEAKITSTDQIYIFSGYKYDQNQNPSEDYTTKDIGLELTVKPHINENRVVMMEITQSISQPGETGAPQSGLRVSSSRTLNASIAVRDRQTIVLGGLVADKTTRTRAKVPLLGDIPLVGRLFNSTDDLMTKAEIVVFITPYVLNTKEDIDAETLRRKDSTSIGNLWKRGWSDSSLAVVTPGEAREEKKRREELRKSELLRFIERQERKWAGPVRDVDAWVGEQKKADAPR